MVIYFDCKYIKFILSCIKYSYGLEDYMLSKEGRREVKVVNVDFIDFCGVIMLDRIKRYRARLDMV